MGRIAVVAYRPRPGKDALLLELTRQHLPILLSQGLATNRPSCVMRALDGTIIEVFEWASKEALRSAHTNPIVQEMWKRYAEACEFVSLTSVKECGDMFAEFDPVEL